MAGQSRFEETASLRSPMPAIPIRMAKLCLP